MKTHPHAVITGASSGIGEAFALELFDRGYSVHLVARREDRLDTLARTLRAKGKSGEVAPVTWQRLDLENREDQNELEKYLASETVDLLINNVGRGSYGFFEELSRAQEEAMVVLNVIAPLRFSHAVIPQMKLRKSGGILFVSSIAAFQPLPYMSTYGATKSANLSQAMSLREELAPFGIIVSALCPGPVATEFGGVARVPGTVTGIYRDSAEMVVKEALKAHFGNQRVCVPGLRAKVLRFISKLLPGALSTKATAYLINPSRLLEKK